MFSVLGCRASATSGGRHGILSVFKGFLSTAFGTALYIWWADWVGGGKLGGFLSSSRTLHVRYHFEYESRTSSWVADLNFL